MKGRYFFNLSLQYYRDISIKVFGSFYSTLCFEMLDRVVHARAIGDLGYSLHCFLTCICLQFNASSQVRGPVKIITARLLKVEPRGLEREQTACICDMFAVLTSWTIYQALLENQIATGIVECRVSRPCFSVPWRPDAAGV